jgi:hypothetical protein
VGRLEELLAAHPEMRGIWDGDEGTVNRQGQDASGLK